MKQQRGFTLTELILAASGCRSQVTDVWASGRSIPGAGNFGCESSSATSKYVGGIRTTQHGEVQLTVQNMDAATNGLHLYLKPFDASGNAAIEQGKPGTVANRQIARWDCGVAIADTASRALINDLPATCRTMLDITGTFAP